MPLRLLLALLFAAIAVPAQAAVPDKFLLDDSDGVAVLNVRQLAASPLFKKHYLALVKKSIQGSEVASREFKAIGLDPLRDIGGFVIVHAESSHRLDPKPGGKAESGLYFILRGKFDLAKIQARAEQIAKDAPKLLKIHSTVRGTLYEFVLEQPLFIGVPDQTALVVSPFREQVMEAMEKGAGKRKLQLKSQAMQKLIAAADAKQTLWLAGIGSMIYDFNTSVVVVKGKKVAKTTKERLAEAGVTSISGGIRVSDGIQTAIVVNCPDEKAAKKNSQFIQEDVTEGVQRAFQKSLTQKQFEPLGAYLRLLEAAPKGKTITIRGDVTAKEFEDAAK